jgi:TetR/AcrR family transcriptional regulator, biofilm operon repressor
MEKTKKELTKEKIQQAAFKCVARFGFEKTNLDDIAKEVGLNKASLYYYYKNKEDIFLDITTTATRQFLESLLTSTAAVAGGVVAQVRHFLLERALYYVRMTEQVHITEETLRQVERLFWAEMQDVAAQERAFLSDLLSKAIENKEMKSIETVRLATHLIAFSESIKHLAKAEFPDGKPAEAIATHIGENLDFMLDLVFDGLKK